MDGVWMWIAALWNATGNINTNRPGSSGGDGGDDTSQLGYILWLMPNEMESNLCIRNTNCESTYNSLDNYTFPAPFISTTPAPKSTSENNNDSFQRCEGTERCATISTSGEGVCHHCESPSREDLKICWWLTTLQLMHHGLLRDTGHQRVLAGTEVHTKCCWVTAD